MECSLQRIEGKVRTRTKRWRKRWRKEGRKQELGEGRSRWAQGKKEPLGVEMLEGETTIERVRSQKRERAKERVRESVREPAYLNDRLLFPSRRLSASCPNQTCHGARSWHVWQKVYNVNLDVKGINNDIRQQAQDLLCMAGLGGICLSRLF